MKNILLTILLTILSLTIYSQINKTSYLEFGYENNILTGYNIASSIYGKEVIIDKMIINYLNNSLFGELHYGIDYKGIELFTNIKTYFLPIKIESYRPQQVNYIIGGNYTYKKLQLKYEHMCGHSIDSKNYRQSYDKISLRINI